MLLTPFDIHYIKYDKWYDEKGYLIYQIEVEAFKKLGFSSYSLEIGVGTGRFSQVLNIEIGLDISFNMLKIGRERILNPIQATAYSLPFRDSVFKRIYVIVTICFTEKPELMLKEIYRVLVKNGEVVLGYVPRESPWGKYYMSLAKENHIFYSYAKFYSDDEVLSLLRENSFKVTETFSTLLQPPNHVEKIEMPVEGFKKDAGFIIIKATKI